MTPLAFIMNVCLGAQWGLVLDRWCGGPSRIRLIATLALVATAAATVEVFR